MSMLQRANLQMGIVHGFVAHKEINNYQEQRAAKYGTDVLSL
jgi:hypothetical protein